MSDSPTFPDPNLPGLDKASAKQFPLGDTVFVETPIYNELRQPQDDTAVHDVSFLFRHAQSDQEWTTPATYDADKVLWRGNFLPTVTGFWAVRVMYGYPVQKLAWRGFIVAEGPGDQEMSPGGLWISSSGTALIDMNGGSITGLRISDMPELVPDGEGHLPAGLTLPIVYQTEDGAVHVGRVTADNFRVDGLEAARQAGENAGSISGAAAAAPHAEAAAQSEEIALGAADMSREERIAAEAARDLADQRAADAEAARDDAVAGLPAKLDKAGGAMTGPLALIEPSEQNHAARKADVDAGVAAAVNVAGVRYSDKAAFLSATVPPAVTRIVLDGYYAAGDGGAACWVEMAAEPTFGQAWGRDQSGRIFGLSAPGSVDIRQFGARNRTQFPGFDSGAAIQAAVDYLFWEDPTGGDGGVVFCPTGVYHSTQTITVRRATRFVTAGKRNTSMSYLGTTDAPFFDVTAEAVEFVGIQMGCDRPEQRYQPLIRIASGVNCLAQDCWFGSPPHIVIESSGQTDLRNSFFFQSADINYTQQPVSVRVLGGRCDIMQPSFTRASSGIFNGVAVEVLSCERVALVNPRVVGYSTALSLIPAAGQTVINVTAVAPAFVSLTGDVVAINPAAGGTVRKVSIISPDTTNSGARGIYSGGAGSIGTVEILDGMVRGSAQHNVQIDKAANFYCTSGLHQSVAGSGLAIGAGVSRWHYEGRAGSQGNYPGNARYGVEVAPGSSDYYTIRGDLRGNAIGSLLDGGTGRNKTISAFTDEASDARVYVSAGANFVIDSTSADGSGAIVVNNFVPALVFNDKSAGNPKGRLKFDGYTYDFSNDRALDGLFSEILLRLRGRADAVNFLAVTPGASGAGPTLAVEGGDINAGISVSTKGTGKVTLNNAVVLRGYQFPELPPAADYLNATVRVTDRLNRLATSDGTNWRFADGTVVI